MSLAGGPTRILRRTQRRRRGDLFDVEDMIVTGAVGGGAAEYHGGTPTASFAPRGFEAPRGAPTLWRRRRATGSPARRGGFGGGRRDGSARRPVSLALPVAASRRGASAAGRSALDARGNVILHATSDGRAAMYDARAGAGATRDPVADVPRATFRRRLGGGGVNRGVAAFAPGTRAARSTSGRHGSCAATAPATPSRSSTCVARPGPARRSAVAPRRRVGDDEPAACSARGRAAAAAAAAGCFTSVVLARGGDGTLIVAPRPPPADAPRDAREGGARRAACSVYTSAHGGTGGARVGGGGGAGGGDGEDGDGFALPKKKKERAKEKKTRRKYPKRQGGKFRARTAGG